MATWTRRIRRFLLNNGAASPSRPCAGKYGKTSKPPRFTNLGQEPPFWQSTRWPILPRIRTRCSGCLDATAKKAVWNSNRPPSFPKANLNIYIIRILQVHAPQRACGGRSGYDAPTALEVWLAGMATLEQLTY